MAKHLPAPVQGEDARYKRRFSIPILYYNPDTFVVVDKPFDVRIDGDASQSPTLQSLLDAAFPQHAPLRLVHQLDHVTSGVHVWGTTRTATRHAGSLFQQRKTRKTYSAIVAGFVLASDFFINSPIADMLFDERKRMCVGSEGNPGREAKTHVTVVKRGYMKFAGSDRIKKVSLLELKPESGRRHQLRVHMAHIGHPIVGDVLYERPFSTDSPRTMLHAKSLFMPLPLEGDLLFEAPDPFPDLLMKDEDVTEEMRRLADLPSNMPKIWMRYGLDGTPVTDEDLQINERATTVVDLASVESFDVNKIE